MFTVHAASPVLLVSPQERHQWMGGTALPSLEKKLLPCQGKSLRFSQFKHGGELAQQRPGRPQPGPVCKKLSGWRTATGHCSSCGASTVVLHKEMLKY